MRKKLRSWIMTFILIMVLIMIMTSCSTLPDRIDTVNGSPGVPGEMDILDAPTAPESETASNTLSAFKTALEVLEAVKGRDYPLLASHAHPEKGIIFSPDAYVDYQEDSVFTAEQITEFGSGAIYDWGYYDVSDEPLKLTADEYFTHYVYNKEFLSCRQIGVNSIIWSGNCPENVAEAFPDSIFVDFHDEGTEELDGIDWSSLKIVMEPYNGMFKVVAIINSGYTL